MKLKEYLAKYEIKVSEFAKQIGYAPNYISSMCTGREKPNKKFIRVIKNETNGQVTFEETEKPKDK